MSSDSSSAGHSQSQGLRRVRDFDPDEEYALASELDYDIEEIFEEDRHRVRDRDRDGVMDGSRDAENMKRGVVQTGREKERGQLGQSVYGPKRLLGTIIEEDESVLSRRSARSGRSSLRDSTRSPQPTTVRRHTLLAPALRPHYPPYLKIVLRAVLLVCILIWTLLPLYYASVATAGSRTTNLKVLVVVRDTGRLGQTIKGQFAPDAGVGVGNGTATSGGTAVENGTTTFTSLVSTAVSVSTSFSSTASADSTSSTGSVSVVSGDTDTDTDTDPDTDNDTDTDGTDGTAVNDTDTNAVIVIKGIQLGWVAVPEENYPTDEDVVGAVVREEVWASLVVNPNATLLLNRARQIGNKSFDPTIALTLYTNQARNEVVYSTFLKPGLSAALKAILGHFAADSIQRYLATLQSNTKPPTANATALSLLAQAPQTIAPGVDYKEVNLRPYAFFEGEVMRSAGAVQIVTLVGQVFVCVFTFITTIAHSTARTRLSPHLHTRSYIHLRLLTPLLTYIPLSLSYALVALSFHIPFSARYSQPGAGFVLFWVFVWLAMCSLGLALEAVVTLLGVRFTPFFLVCLIIVNVSTAALPPELQPGVFAYGAGFPFYNFEQAVRTILFNTGPSLHDPHAKTPRLAQNAAILVAWGVLSGGTLCVFTWVGRVVEERGIRVSVRVGRRGDGRRELRVCVRGREGVGAGAGGSVGGGSIGGDAESEGFGLGEGGVSREQKGKEKEKEGGVSENTA